MKSKIKAMTDAKIPLDVVDKTLLDYLRARRSVYVSARQLRSSTDLLISENYARCQGIGFLDECCEVGALAHNYSSYDPYSFLTGQWSNGERHIEDPRRIFNDMGKVVAVHVYHNMNYEWPERWIEGASRKVGVERVVHIPIKSREPGKRFWRDIAQDVKTGTIYVFPTDFDYGIAFRLNGT